MRYMVQLLCPKGFWVSTDSCDSFDIAERQANFLIYSCGFCARVWDNVECMTVYNPS